MEGETVAVIMVEEEEGRAITLASTRALIQGLETGDVATTPNLVVVAVEWATEEATQAMAMEATTASAFPVEETEDVVPMGAVLEEAAVDLGEGLVAATWFHRTLTLVWASSLPRQWRKHMDREEAILSRHRSCQQVVRTSSNHLLAVTTALHKEGQPPLQLLRELRATPRPQPWEVRPPQARKWAKGSVMVNRNSSGERSGFDNGQACSGMRIRRSNWSWLDVSLRCRRCNFLVPKAGYLQV